MRTFRRRSDPRYQKHLWQCLDLDGPNGLIATAEEFDEPIAQGSQEFSRGIGIDFVGCTATTLFDAGRMIAKHCHFDQVQSLVSAVGKLNKEGISVRFRILILYPYSAAGQLRIQAENSTRRSSINESDFDRGDDFIEQLTNETFFASSLFSTSQMTLKVIYDWRRSLGDDHSLNSPPNRFALRFSIMNPIVCGLRVNQRFFFDVYSYSKLDRNQTICSGDTQPVIEVTREDGMPYDSFCDHFRYLWNFDATLDAEDAVDLTGDSPRLKSPEEINFRRKVERLADQVGESRTRLERRHFRRKASRILEKHCPPVLPRSSAEVAFLGCAWHTERKVLAAPNIAAAELRDIWARYFLGDLQTIPRIEIRHIAAAAGKELGELLYPALREATIGIIVLSAEVPVADSGEYLCSPNVYHELGYLMAHLSKERTFVFRDTRVRVPSNIGNLICVDFEEKKIALGFLKLIEGLREATVLGEEDAKQIAEQHVKALERMEFEEEDMKWAEDFVKTRFPSGLHSGQ